MGRLPATMYKAIRPGAPIGCLRLAPLPPVPAASAGREADPGPGEISLGEYRSLVRLAALLLHDAPAAEDVVQEAFAAVHAGRRRPRDRGKALSCLRREVISRSRLAVSHRAVAGRTVPAFILGRPGAEPGAVALLAHSAFLAALRSLPCLQREAIVLRYYAGLPRARQPRQWG